MTSPSPALTEAATSRFVSVRLAEKSFKVHYNDAGGDAHGSQTVVMLHGSGPGATGWGNFGRSVGAFVSAGYRVLAPTFPGWGKSDPVVCTGSRPELNARFLQGFLDALDVGGRVRLMGNSMGAHSALAFALACPERVDRLVLIGGGMGSTSIFQPALTEGIRRMHDVYRKPSLERVKDMLDVLLFDSRTLTQEAMQAALDNVLARPEHLANFIRSIDENPRQYPDVSSRLGEITAPTLLVWGRDDRFVPLDVGLRLLAGMPNADMHVIGGCGHGVLLEHAAKVNRMALDFFAK